MTCKQLGGACEEVFVANTFEEIAAMSKAHGMKMFKLGDLPHLEAMKKMKALMESPDAMKQWFENKRKAFEALPDS